MKNKIKDMRSDGLDIETDANLVSANQITGVAANGIELEGSDNSIARNKIRDVAAGFKEIEVVGEGNTVSDNKACVD